jgi:hypothetical protein
MKRYSPIEYIKIDIANHYGYDKKTFAQRIAWVDSIKDLRAKVHSAEKPPQFLAAVYALEDALDGEPSGHLVGLDACASGISILGILSGCHTTSQNTGIIGTKRMDFYKVCTDTMNELLPTDIEVKRIDAKQATMTSYYGSKAKPKEIFGDETDELMAFYQAQEYIAPGACMMMRELLASWQPYALEHSHTMPDGFNSIVPVLQKCKAKIEVDELLHTTLTYIYEDNIGSEKGLAVAANATHACDSLLVRELVRRCNYDKEQLVNTYSLLTSHANTPITSKTIHPFEQLVLNHFFISLRGAEIITAENVLEFSLDYREELRLLLKEVLSKPRFDVICIHDEYKCHANYMNILRETYMTILAELADSTVGQQLIRELRNDDSYVLTKLSTDLASEIMKSEYTLS